MKRPMPSNLRTIPEAAGGLCGVQGLWYPRHFDADTGRIVSQVFRSGYRVIRGVGRIIFEARFDDSCSNGAPSFAITGTVWDPVRGAPDSDAAHLASGCVHAEIAARFPEVAGLIRWHLTDSAGPLHYVANTIYHAGDRDHRGLRKGETRPLAGPDGKVWFELVAVAEGDIWNAIKPGHLEAAKARIAAQGTVPLYMLQADCKGGPLDADVPSIEWRPQLVTGEGKARDLAAARSCAVWPGVPDQVLTLEPDALRALLEARLPALREAFAADMRAAGFLLSIPAGA